MIKDLFSGHADVYAAFRPSYPEELYRFIFGFVKTRDAAWDSGTGNGQVAQRLSLSFSKVYATDVSENQIRKAVQAANIKYTVSPAEHTEFPDASFDLITVGQALHWFDTDKFYDEVRRVAKPGCVLAAWGYGNIIVNDVVDAQINHFYHNVVGKYWDSARHHIETAYREIEFPFEEIPSPEFHIRQNWTLRHLLGYLESWSATQKYIMEVKDNPVDEFAESLRSHWGNDQELLVQFPVFLKVAIL